MDSCVDPTGRIVKGMIVRQIGATNPDSCMEVIDLCAPSGLYHRPPEFGDPKWYALRMIPCDANHPKAKYKPSGLMARIRYLSQPLTPGYTHHTTIGAEHVEETGHSFINQYQ